MKSFPERRTSVLLLRVTTEIDKAVCVRADGLVHGIEMGGKDVMVDDGMEGGRRKTRDAGVRQEGRNAPC